jgi:hypothetical protein
MKADADSNSVTSFPPLFGLRRKLKFRPLERIDFPAEDGTALCIHHTSGGDRGPVIITPGTAMTALTYCIDTVGCNFVEFLVEKGFDVWLFDWRTSPLIAAHEQRYALEDVAKFDWPAALAEVRRRTDKDQVAVMAHCLSSTAFMLSLVRGYIKREHVYAFVASQVGLHLDLIPAEWLKLQTRLDWLLPGGDMIHQKPSQRSGQVSDMAISVLALFPRLFFRCDNPTCYRHTATFGGLIFHPRVNSATHAMMGEIVPECLTAFLKDVARGVRSGSVLAQEDLQHFDRLQLPITFVSGSENRMFIPESTARTFNLLCEKNGPTYYKRKVYPGFGHLDSFVGDGARTEIWPDIAEALGTMKTQSGSPPDSRGRETPFQSTRSKKMRKKTLGFAFCETMSGGFMLGRFDPETGYHEGQRAPHSLSLVSAVSILDLDRFIAEPDHVGHLHGSIDYLPFGKTIFSKSGVFNLFSPTNDPKLKLIVYEMLFERGGEDYYFVGRKEIKNGPISNLWRETTTLFAQLHKGSDKSGSVVGAGILTLAPLGLLKAVRTMHAVNATSALEEIEAPLTYLRFFSGQLWDSFLRRR